MPLEVNEQISGVHLIYQVTPIPHQLPNHIPVKSHMHRQGNFQVKGQRQTSTLRLCLSLFFAILGTSSLPALRKLYQGYTLA